MSSLWIKIGRLAQKRIAAARTLTTQRLKKPDVFNQVKANENLFIYKYIHRRFEQEKKGFTIFKDINKAKTSSFSQQLDPRELVDKIAQQAENYDKINLASSLHAIQSVNTKEACQLRAKLNSLLQGTLRKQQKLSSQDVDLYFYISDMFHICPGKFSFVDKFIQHLTRYNLDALTDKQLLHLLLLMILQRRNYANLLDVSGDRLLKILEHADFEEVVIIALAYFKTKTRIQNRQLLDKLVMKTVDLIPSIDPKEPGYCAIIKSIRYSALLDCRDNVKILISKLSNDLNSRIILSSPYNIVHTVKLMEAYRIYNSNLLDDLATSMFSSHFRIKDIQYALTSLSNFAYNDLHVQDKFRYNLDKLCDMIATESRKDALMQYFHIMPLIRALSILGYYNASLFEYVNSLLSNRKRSSEMLSAIESEKSALLVYVASRIESDVCHFGDSALLFQSMSNKINRSKDSWVLEARDPQQRSKILTDGANTNFTSQMESLARRLAAQHDLACCTFSFQYTLPHQNYLDLIVSDGQSPGDFHQSTLMPRKIMNGKNHCLIYALSKFDYVDGQSRLSGYKRLIIRLLKHIGYNVICVDLNDPDVGSIVQKIKTFINDK